MVFKINSLYLTDSYKTSHKKMLAPGTTKLYGTWIPRSTKHAPKGITKIVSFGQQLVWKWLHDEFEENFFFTKERVNGEHPFHKKIMPELKAKALLFIKDMCLHLGSDYDGKHFEELWDLGYLPIKVKALPEGIETNPNIPHMTFINTVDEFAWLPLYLETILSSLAWKPSTAATIAKLYRRQAEEWVAKTDPDNMWLVDFMCHDFSARGLDPMSQYLIGLGHATSFKGSDTLPVIPASRYFYGVKDDEMPIYSVNASEHSVSCTQLFYYEDQLKQGLLNDKIKEYYSFDLPADGSVENPDYLTIAEWLMLDDWLDRFPEGILSVVDDTMNTWKHITQVIARLKDKILARKGKLVTRPDSGDPVDIICGLNTRDLELNYNDTIHPSYKGVIELLWDIFGGTTNKQGYKVLDPHIGAIYGDSITPERQLEIYRRLEAKGFAATNIVLGVGSFTYQYNTRDTLGFAAKGAWFEVESEPTPIPDSIATEEYFDSSFFKPVKKSYNIYKDPVTDDGTKKSLKGLLAVGYKINEDGSKSDELICYEECTQEAESKGLLQTIYINGEFHNQTTLTEIRKKLQ